MMRTWRMFVLPALVTTSLAVGAAAGGEGKDTPDKTKTIQEQLKDLNLRIVESFEKVGEDIRGLKQDLKVFKADQLDLRTKLNLTLGKLASLELTVNDLKSEVDSLQKRSGDIRLYPSSDKATIEELRARIAQLEASLARVQDRPRVALSSPASGRIVLVNTYPYEELSFVVNGRTYRVAPGVRLPLEGQPAGVFNYEVFSPTWGSRGRNTTTLEPGQTFTITATP
jgi:hypothetical protein